jgi:hypothetical protein
VQIAAATAPPANTAHSPDHGITMQTHVGFLHMSLSHWTVTTTASTVSTPRAAERHTPMTAPTGVRVSQVFGVCVFQCVHICVPSFPHFICAPGSQQRRRLLPLTPLGASAGRPSPPGRGGEAPLEGGRVGRRSNCRNAQGAGQDADAGLPTARGRRTSSGSSVWTKLNSSSGIQHAAIINKVSQQQAVAG